jgi:enoyl-CoA hydratase
MPLVSYQMEDGVAHITMDDGKVNALSPELLSELHEAVRRAAGDAAPVVLRGRDGIFSAGFDLKVLTGGGGGGPDLLKSGFTLAERVLSHPAPVVVACTGHAIAMGLFLTLSGDYRIGVAGPYRLTANEVAIGMTLPRTATEICRYRLTPACFDRAIVLAEVFSPEAAVTAGILDRVVDPGGLDAAVDETVTRLRTLNMVAHHATKLRARAALLDTLREAIAADDADFRGGGS